MSNLALRKKTALSPFRKVAIGTWQTTYDPSVYGIMTIRMDEALRYMRAFRERTGKHLTISHMVAKAIGHVLKEVPDANAVLRWNRIYLRDNIGVFYQVVMQDPKTGELDLSGATVREPQDKSLEQIIDEFTGKVGGVREGTDKKFKGSRDMMSWMPFSLLNFMLKLTSFLSYTLNIDLRWAGIPKDPFGSVMVTNVGSIGLPTALVPLVPYSRVPLLLALGSVEDRPVIDANGQVVAAKVMEIGATFDHRILDGGHAAKMHKIMRAWIEDPFAHFDPLPGSASSVK